VLDKLKGSKRGWGFFEFEVSRFCQLFLTPRESDRPDTASMDGGEAINFLLRSRKKVKVASVPDLKKEISWSVSNLYQSSHVSVDRWSVFIYFILFYSFISRIME